MLLLQELRSESDELTSLDEMLPSSGAPVSSEMLWVFLTGVEELSFAFSVVEWMETWSAGNAVLQGIGLEITRDFLFFDLPDVLLQKKKYI